MGHGTQSRDENRIKTKESLLKKKKIIEQKRGLMRLVMFMSCSFHVMFMSCSVQLLFVSWNFALMEIWKSRMKSFLTLDTKKFNLQNYKENSDKQIEFV